MPMWNVFGRGFDSRRLHHSLIIKSNSYSKNAGEKPSPKSPHLTIDTNTKSLSLCGRAFCVRRGRQSLSFGQHKTIAFLNSFPGGQRPAPRPPLDNNQTGQWSKHHGSTVGTGAIRRGSFLEGSVYGFPERDECVRVVLGFGMEYGMSRDFKGIG